MKAGVMTESERASRIYYHLYVTNEGIQEHAERIVKLEELCSQLMRHLNPAERQDACNRECPAYELCCGSTYCEFTTWVQRAAREVEIEVELMPTEADYTIGFDSKEMTGLDSNGKRVPLELMKSESDNTKMRTMIADAISLLNWFCENQHERGCDCPAWPDHDKQCLLRDLEDEAKSLGIEVDDGD